MKQLLLTVGIILTVGAIVIYSFISEPMVYRTPKGCCVVSISNSNDSLYNLKLIDYKEGIQDSDIYSEKELSIVLDNIFSHCKEVH